MANFGCSDKFGGICVKRGDEYVYGKPREVDIEEAGYAGPPPPMPREGVPYQPAIIPQPVPIHKPPPSPYTTPQYSSGSLRSTAPESVLQNGSGATPEEEEQP